MLKKVNGQDLDINNAHLANRTRIENKILDTYFCKDKPVCFRHEYLKIEEEGKDTKIEEVKTEILDVEKANEWLEFVGSPSRIFTDKKEFEEYKKNAEEIKELDG